MSILKYIEKNLNYDDNIYSFEIVLKNYSQDDKMTIIILSIFRYYIE